MYVCIQLLYTKWMYVRGTVWYVCMNTQVLSLVVTRRMSFLKDVGQTKKYLEHSKRVGMYVCMYACIYVL